MSRARLDIAIQQIRNVRKVLDGQLREVADVDWFVMPPGGVTHIGWQVGHLAASQYALCMRRIRGERPEDQALVPGDFMKRYARESQPQPGAENNLPVDALKTALARVFDQSLAELAAYQDADLSGPVTPPHPIFSDKLGAIEWCAIHEMNHVGQITLLRRLLGGRINW